MMRPAFERLESQQSTSGCSPYLRVLLQVDGIHCPSCVEHITRLLRDLPLPVQVDSISVSFLDHTVLFHLPLSSTEVVELSEKTKEILREVVEALKEEGYPPSAFSCKIIREYGGRQDLHSATFVPFHDEKAEKKGAETPSDRLPKTWSLYERIRHPQRTAKLMEAERERQRQWLRHLSVCRSCREESEGKVAAEQHASSTSSSQSSNTVEKRKEESSWTAKLSIGGMTCSACVSNVAKAAETVKTLHHIDVNLMSQSALAVINSEEDIATLVEAINDAGYDAELVSKERIQQSEEDRGKRWTATFTVGGMTCASCVSNVEKAVAALNKDLPSFSVGLMQGTAVASLIAATSQEAERQAAVIHEAIEDAGYDCILEQISEEKRSDPPSSQRTVRVRVDGMFCSHCIEKVKQYCRDQPDIHKQDLDVERLTLASPVFTVTYSPSTSFHIRSILGGLNALDPAFHAHIITPPSISSRSAEHARKELHSLSVRLALAFLFVPPVLLIAVIVPTFLSTTHPLRMELMRVVVGQAALGDFILLALATPVQFGVGSVFYQRAFKSLRSVWRKGRSWTDRLISWGDMNVLVALGTSVAFFASVAFLIVDATRFPSMVGEQAQSNMLYFDACNFLVFFILLGRVLEVWSKRKTSSAVSALGSLRPSTGLLLQQPSQLTSSAVETVSVDLLEVGDLVLIPSGTSPPVDSELVSTPAISTAAFLESAISGESKSVMKKEGDLLYAGTVNQSNSAVVARVTTLAGSNLIDNVIDIVQTSSTRKADVEQLADRVTSHFVPVIVALALIVFIIWLAILYAPGGVSEQWKQKHIQHYERSGSLVLYALQFAVSVLVVACPCGIGLAAPTAQIIAIGLASKHGVLVQGGGQAFQSAVRLAKAKQSKAFVFDKTGTITHGKDGGVQDSLAMHLSSATWTKQEMWKAVWLVEGSSAHPLSTGIRIWCETQFNSNEVDDIQLGTVEEVVGRGLRATIILRGQSFTLLIGSMALMRLDDSQECEVHVPMEMQSEVDEWQSKGASVVFVALHEPEGRRSDIVAALSMADTVRPEAATVLATLQERYQGDLWIVSGDAAHTAHAIASQVGITEPHVIAGVLPTEKAEWVERIKRASSEDLEGKRRQLVAFIGDGINDAPALSMADLSIALGSGSSLATSTASFILLNSERPLSSIPAILSLSRATHHKIWQNLVWACAFNAIFIPIAAGAFVQKNFTFGPSWSGLAMALSSVSVVLNALTLRFWRAPKTV